MEYWEEWTIVRVCSSTGNLDVIEIAELLRENCGCITILGVTVLIRRASCFCPCHGVVMGDVGDDNLQFVLNETKLSRLLQFCYWIVDCVTYAINTREKVRHPCQL